MKVQDILKTRVGSCGPKDNLAEVVHVMWESDCGMVPIVDAMNTVIGVLTDRDVCMALGTRDRRAAEVTAEEVASAKVVTCHPRDDVRAALDLMASEAVRRLPVVNDAGQLVGVVSITDALLAARSTRTARQGDPTWTDVMLSLDAICRPRTAEPAHLPAAVKTR